MSSREVIKSGFLRVEVAGEYTPQFVELTTTSLDYYDKKEKSTFFFGKDRSKTGSVVLDYHSHVVNNSVKSGAGGFCFLINRDGKAVKFLADTLEEKKNWVEAIEEVINEEEVDSVNDSVPSTPLVGQGAEPIVTPSSRHTYKSYLKGFLRMSSTNDGKWNKVWCIISMEALSYYTSTSDTNRLGHVDITEATEVHSENDNVVGDEFIFFLKNKGQCAYFETNSEESRLTWMNTIYSVKKMNLCRSEGDLGTMWQWESHLRANMTTEIMPSDPRLKLRSASIYGVRPELLDDDHSDGDDDFPSVKNIMPLGLSKVFGAIENGAESTIHGISSGAKTAVSGVSKGIVTLDSGRKKVQNKIVDGVKDGTGAIIDGTGALIDTIDAGCSKFIPSFGDDGYEMFDADSDTFGEYYDDENIKSDTKHRIKSSNHSDRKNITAKLRGKLMAISTVGGAVALLLCLFISYSSLSSLGYLLMSVECFLLGCLIFASYQHVLGYFVGLAVRYKLTNSIHGDGRKFDIHFNAIKLNVSLDLVEVEIRGLQWNNPDKYKGSYGQAFLKIKAIKIAIPLMSLYRVVIDKHKTIKISQFLVDSPLVTLAEAGKGKDRDFNVTCAVGQSETNLEADSQSDTSEQSKGEERRESAIYLIDMKSFVLLNAKIRLRNIFRVKSNNLHVPYIVMMRESLTGPPRGKHRRPLPIPELATLLIKEIGAELITENKVAMVNILSTSGARHLMSLFDPRNIAKLLR